MEIQGLGNLHSAQAVQGPHRPQAAAPEATGDGWLGVDQLDISREADMVSRAHDLPEIRADRVADIRMQIAAGTYETEANLELAVGRLLDELSG
jgi:negative regulator of flagellin synthesis FlgM